MIDQTCSDNDSTCRIEAAIRAYLECRERGEQMHKLDESPHASEIRAALQELIDDERALEPWLGPLHDVTQTAEVGRLFGNYELLELIGEGGQGVVYRARQVHINREVALKLVNPRDRCRSLRELIIAGNLEHEHLIRVYHVGEHACLLYFTMKLAEKGSLKEQIHAYGLPTAPAITADEQKNVAKRQGSIALFVAKIARAVQYLHEQGILHRDLKPGNILLDAQGEPHVSDFGLAQQVRDVNDGRARNGSALFEQPDGDAAGTREGTFLGTPGFAAPEQAQVRTDLDERADVYALGSILYKLLTDRTPFVGTNDEIVEQTADMERPVPAPSLYTPNVDSRVRLGVGLHEVPGEAA